MRPLTGRHGQPGPLEIASSRAAHLLEALDRAHDVLGFPQATGHDEVFRQLVLASISERIAARTTAVK